MDIFEILAEPIRMRLIEVLASGTHYRNDLVDIGTHEFGVSSAAIDHHLRVLREHGIARAHPDWPQVLYELDASLFREVNRKMRRLKFLWDRRIGWKTDGDPFRICVNPSRRGYRGHGVDPDDPWGPNVRRDGEAAERAPIPRQ